MRFRLIDDWENELLRLWSVRWSLFLAAASGLSGVWFALQGYVPLWLFILVGVLGPVVLVILRMIKQPEIEP